MSEVMSFNTELSIHVNGILIPIHSIEYTINVPKRRIHTLHKHNVGYFHPPKEFDFTLRLYEMGEGQEAKTMLLLGLQDTEFQVVLAAYNGEDWTYQQLGFNRCAINRVRGTGFVPDRPPEDLIECQCLEFSVDTALTFGSS